MAVTHSKVSAVADGGDTDLVRPSDWNADHDVSLTAADVGAAPDSVDYLVGTASGGLSGEIAVGTSPGGELGGTWASPTVDATHSGSAHVQIAGDLAGSAATPTVAKASNSFALTGDETSTLTGANNDVTLGANTAVFRWNGAADANFTGLTGGSDGRVVVLMNVTTTKILTLNHLDSGSSSANQFRLPSGADMVLRRSTTTFLVYDAGATPGPAWRVVAQGTNDTNAAGVAVTLDAVPAAPTNPGSAAATGHGHRLDTYASNPAALGSVSAGTSATAPSRGDHVHPTTGVVTTSTSAAGDLSGTYPNPKVAKSSQSFQMSGEETSTLTGSNNDVAIASTTNVLRWDGASSVTFTGLATGSVGRIVILDNVSTSNLTVTLKHDDAGSTTTNRFYLPGAATLVLYRNEAAVLRYENSTGRWKVLHAPTSAATPAAIGTASAGTAGNAPSRDDHVHATGASTPIAIGTAATGTGPAAAMTDHVHPTGAGTPVTQAVGDAAAIGTGPAAAMTDHKHGMPAFGSPVATSTANANGSATTLARSDHVHSNSYIAIGLASDATVNSTTTLVKITGLDLTLGAGSWHFKYLIRYQSALTSTGVKFAVTHSGTVTSFVANHYFNQALSTAATLAPDQDTSGAATGLMGTMAVRAKNVTAGPTVSVDTGASDMLWIVEGLLVVTVSGDLQLFHASEVAADSTVMTGSGLQVVKVA